MSLSAGVKLLFPVSLFNEASYSKQVLINNIIIFNVHIWQFYYRTVCEGTLLTDEVRRSAIHNNGKVYVGGK